MMYYRLCDFRGSEVDCSKLKIFFFFLRDKTVVLLHPVQKEPHIMVVENREL